MDPVNITAYIGEWTFIISILCYCDWELGDIIEEGVSFSLVHRSKIEQDMLEAQHSKVVERLQSEVASLQAEVDNGQLVEAALQEKVERQEELLAQWKERDNSNSTFSGLESEMGALQCAVEALEKDKDTLTLKVSEQVPSKLMCLGICPLRSGDCWSLLVRI